MGIERDLHDLLFCHDCVIVPQWGGFLTHYRPARLDEARRVIHPPGKELSFNRHLVRNDGLLADHLAKRESIAFDRATARIDAEVAGWRLALDREGRLELPYIGIFFRDAEHNLQFDPDKRSNYHKDAHGLRPLNAVPVEQSWPVVVPLTPEPATARELHEARRSPVLWVAAGVAALLFGAAAIWAYRMGGNGQAQWSGMLPWKPKPETAYVAPAQAGFVPVQTPKTFTFPETDTGVHEVVLDEENDVRMIVDLGPARIAAADTTAVAMRPSAVAETLHRFHVVGGCFAQPENADKLLADLLAKGFPARRLRKRGQLHPVAFGSYGTRAEALAALDVIRQRDGRSAWLLVR
ncbi:MAG: SPOR domain-containing protein [Flavobacteriales bacterium]|nr:SPOR domain-containing protein [Flavobacteriales bacterium]